MYVPQHFKEERVPVLHGLMRRHPFAMLVTLGADGLAANHLPMELVDEPPPLGILRCHVSRANPVWKTSAEALVVFQGPHGYISPSWYPSKAETGAVVPTWNYAVVHAHGRPRIVEDRAWLREHVGRLTQHMEAPRPDPWRVSDAPGDFIDKMLNGIVGIEIAIARLEGKWKVSQNRPAPDRAGVVAGLGQSADSTERELSGLVAEAAGTPKG
jgi:transcriptional regulator